MSNSDWPHSSVTAIIYIVYIITLTFVVWRVLSFTVHTRVGMFSVVVEIRLGACNDFPVCGGGKDGVPIMFWLPYYHHHPLVGAKFYRLARRSRFC